MAAYQHPVTAQHPHGAPINWQQVAAASYRFAAVKGTEGNYYVNPWARTDLAEAKAAGLDVSPYHFAIPNVSSGPQQAAYAVQHSGYQPGAQTLPLALDIADCWGDCTGRATALPPAGCGSRPTGSPPLRRLDDVFVLAVHQRRDRARGGQPGHHRPRHVQPVGGRPH